VRHPEPLFFSSRTMAMRSGKGPLSPVFVSTLSKFASTIPGSRSSQTIRSIRSLQIRSAALADFRYSHIFITSFFGSPTDFLLSGAAPYVSDGDTGFCLEGARRYLEWTALVLC